MAGINLTGKGNLVRLSDSNNLRMTNVVDYRGRTVVDRNGEEIGDVKDVFVDEKEHRPRFLEISSGGFLGIGATTFLVPIDAVSNLNEDRITIGQERSRFTSHPKYDPSHVDERFLSDTYSFYGKSPYWNKGYQYPTFPTSGGVR